MTSDRLREPLRALVPAPRAALSARLPRRHGRRGRGDLSRPRARRPAPRRDPAPRRSCGCARSWTRCATVPANACGPRSRGGATATGAATRRSRLRRLLRARAFAAVTIGTLTIGLGMVAVVYTVVHKILIEPMPYRDADALYYVWRDYGPIVDLKRGGLAGPDVTELRKSERRRRGRRGAPADARRDLRAARGRRPERDRGDGRHAEPLRRCSA